MTETINTAPVVAPAVVPDIGDRFHRPGHVNGFVVVGWLRRVPLEPLPLELAELFADVPPRAPLLVFCVRGDAEFVVGHGVCGVIVPVGEVVVVGCVGWSVAHMGHARRRAALLVGEFVQAG